MALGVAALLGVTAVRKLADDAPPAATSVELERVTRLLAEGEKLLLEGDVEGAKEQFAKASGAAENDLRAAQALARVAVLQADHGWLRSRIEGKESDDLPKLIERARAAVAKAHNPSENDPLSVTLELDAFRLQAKLTEARGLVSKLKRGDPDAGRALATLDLCESTPAWEKLIEQLKFSAFAEKKLGHSQAVLIYALARKGDVEGAKRELANLAPSHPLLPILRDYVGKAKPADGATTVSPTASGAPSATADETLVTGDFREAIRGAQAAQKHRNYEEAESLFKRALEKSPGNSEAQSGLAEVSRARGDAKGAEKRYRELLKDNPHFVPGLVGMADLKWQRGDTGGALELYRQVLQSAPGTGYADQAYQRIQEATAYAAAANAAKPSGGKPAGGKRPSNSRPDPVPGANPQIDTTDLP